MAHGYEDTGEGKIAVEYQEPVGGRGSREHNEHLSGGVGGGGDPVNSRSFFLVSADFLECCCSGGGGYVIPFRKKLEKTLRSLAATVGGWVGAFWLVCAGFWWTVFPMVPADFLEYGASGVAARGGGGGDNIAICSCVSLHSSPEI